MSPGVVDEAHPSEDAIDLTGGSKPLPSTVSTPSPHVNDAGPPVALDDESPQPSPATPVMNGSSSSPVARLAERVERARDTIVDTELYAKLSSISSRVGAKLHSAWEFSKTASWIIGTSALVLVVPLLYEMDKELVANDPAAAASAGGEASTGTAAGDGTAPASAT